MDFNEYKIGSVAKNVGLDSKCTIGSQVIAQEGYLVAARVLTEKYVYNQLELRNGRLSTLYKGDLVVGVLGERDALCGYSGRIPAAVSAGDTLQILNMGGVVGECIDYNAEVSFPFQIEILGSVCRGKRPLHIREGAVKHLDSLQSCAPLILVSGTCMNAGKTKVACELIKRLWQNGRKVSAAKVTGVSLLRDTLAMEDCGASKALTFTDAGIVKTTALNAVQSAKGILSVLSQSNPDCIVVELGDGIMGEYGVMEILCDPEISQFVGAHVVCANDQVAAWGAVQFLRDRGPAIDVISGPATDNDVGKRFIQNSLEVAAANAIKESDELFSVVWRKLFGGDSDKRVVNL